MHHLNPAYMVYASKPENLTSPEQLCYQVITQQMQLDNFTVDVFLKVNFSSEQKSEFNFKYHFKKPDLTYIDTTDFVLLPTETLKSLHPSFFQLENYHLSFVDKKGNNYQFELKPRDPRKNFIIHLWIDRKEKYIKQARISFKTPSVNEVFYLTARYKKMDTFSMPVEVEGNLAIPTKFNSEWQIKDFKEGSFHLSLKNYKINRGIPAPILEKMKMKKKSKTR